MINIFQNANFGTENNFENVHSKDHMEWILKSYVESVNKDPEDIGISNITTHILSCILST